METYYELLRTGIELLKTKSPLANLVWVSITNFCTEKPTIQVYGDFGRDKITVSKEHNTKILYTYYSINKKVLFAQTRGGKQRTVYLTEAERLELMMLVC